MLKEMMSVFGRELNGVPEEGEVEGEEDRNEGERREERGESYSAVILSFYVVFILLFHFMILSKKYKRRAQKVRGESAFATLTSHLISSSSLPLQNSQRVDVDFQP